MPIAVSLNNGTFFDFRIRKSHAWLAVVGESRAGMNVSHQTVLSVDPCDFHLPSVFQIDDIADTEFFYVY